MSTLDRYLKKVAQTDLPSEMDQVFGIIEAAYTHVDMLIDALVDHPELSMKASEARGALKNALEYGGSLLSARAQHQQIYDKARAIRAYRYAVTTINEAITRMANVYDQFRDTSQRSLFMQVNEEASKAYQILLGMHDALVAA